MTNRLAILGAPISAGAYAPGQERTPAVLCANGLIEFLTAHGIAVDDYGDVSFMGLRHSEIFGNVLSNSGAFGWAPEQNEERFWHWGIPP
jgi:hypothetical protein